MNQTANRLLPIRHAKKLGGLLLLPLVVAVGCSDNPPPPAKTYTFIQTAGGSLCKIGGPWLLIGTNEGSGDAGPKSVEDNGNTSDGSAVHVSCKVAQNGDSFDFEAVIRKDRNGGTMNLSGTLKDVPGAQGDIIGGFSPNDSGTYRDPKCTITVTGGIAPGRVWGKLDCPQAKREGSKVGDQDETCDINGDFKLENCSQ